VGSEMCIRDRSFQPRVARAIHLAHAAGAERRLDFIRAEFRARGQSHNWVGLYLPKSRNLQVRPESAYALSLAMQRFTARLVLLLVALSTCEPFLQTLYGTPPHACCLRRLHARQDGRPQLDEAATRTGNCCPPLTTPRSARLVAHDGVIVQLQASKLSVELPDSFYAIRYSSHHSSRAPPELPNA